MIALATIAYNKPRLIEEQIRLLEKYLTDDYELHVFNNSDSETTRHRMNKLYTESREKAKWYLLPDGSHDAALNAAAEMFLELGDAPYFGFLDHDIFPTRPTTLIDKIEPTGFYGVGQRHAPTGHLYLWPGFCFFSREWLNGRPLDFSGIRGENPADNGDTGSMLWPLFENETWESMYRPTHSYQPIREPDDFGLQSFGVEYIGDWLHVSNGSHWMKIPNPEERDEIVFRMLSEL